MRRSIAQVISELATLKLSQLRQRALDSNYDADKVDEAIDSDNPRAALAELILSQVSAPVLHFGCLRLSPPFL